MEGSRVIPSKSLFVSLTNIPTPYRLHFYRTLSQALSAQEIELQVWFMANSEPGRYWKLDRGTFGFRYRFAAGIHPLIRNRQFHFNPSFLLSLMKDPPKWLLLSGSWYFPSYFCALFIGLMRGTKVIIWNESNLAYVEYSQPLANRIRGGVMGLADAYAVSGKWAGEYVKFYAPSSKDKPFLHLPNVVDENKYLCEVQHRRTQKERLREKWGISPTKRVIISLTRLEPIKGVMQMLQGWIQCTGKSDIAWLIAGEGSLKRNLQAEIQRSGLDASVRLLGYRTEDEVLDLLALSDAFALPSLGDPYPLAVIEAMFAGLPLLLSDHVGCHPETLEAGENGLLFNPYQENEVKVTLERFMSLTPEEWQTMGKHSLKLAKERFETEGLVRSFAADILTL